MQTTTNLELDMVMDVIWKNRAKDVIEKVVMLEERLNHLETSNKNRYLRQKEVFEMYCIGHTILKQWVKCGLTEIWIDNRVYYDVNDIQVYFEKHKI